MTMTIFEVGKFYKVHITPYSSNKIPAMCIRTTKCVVEFKYIQKTDKFGYRFDTVKRRKKMIGDVEKCYSPDIWSGIMSTYATEHTTEPVLWGEAKEWEE